MAFLSGRLERLAQSYAAEHGIDVTTIPGAGAAGGLAGGLAALGGKLMPGFDIVAEETRFDDAVENCDLVVTGEGLLDETSFRGKVVGSVVEWTESVGVPVRAVVGAVADSLPEETRHRVGAVDLVSLFGRETAMREPMRCIEDAAREMLREFVGSRRS